MDEKELKKLPIPRVVTGVLVYNDEGKLFLARSHKWHGKWIVPGGHLDWGESLVKCAAREVKEETNMDVSEVELICVLENIFSEEFHDKRHMVFLNYAARYIGGEITLNDELDEYEWFSVAQALELDLNSFTKKFIQAYAKSKSL